MFRLLLVDGHANLYRAFYAIRAPLSAPDGTPTGAAYGFLRIQQKLLKDLQPSHVAVAFDVGGETFRTRLDETYKAQRPPMPDDLRVQIPLVQEALRLLGTTVIAEADVEADDVIATLATRAAAAGFEVVIASADKDLMQLVRDPLVKMWHTRYERLLDEAGVTEVFGVPPAQVAEVLSIMGDTSDNVPGCKGLGEKGALELIRRWGTLAAVYEHLDEVTPPRARKLLGEQRDQVELSHRLVCAHAEVPIDIDLADLKRHSPDTTALAECYRRLGFTSLLAELTAVPVTTGLVAPVPTAPATPIPAAAAAAPPAPHADATSHAREVALAELASLLGGQAAVAWLPGEVAVARGDQVVIAHAGDGEIAATLAPMLPEMWCHDAKALIGRCRSAGVEPAGVPSDTMLAGYLVAPGEAVDLAALCRRHDVSPPATDGAADQARVVAALAPGLAARLAAEGLGPVFDDIERPLVPVLEAMERHGIRLDSAVLEDLSNRLAASMAELEREIHAEAGGPFNINSPAQLAEVLFARRGLPVLRKTAKTKAPSTDAEVLAELAARGFRLPALILEFREQGKLKSTYADALPRQVAADGRIHTRFNQAIAATGRLSSSDPNLQNIPVKSALGREVRRAFVADPGEVLLAADYSQIELRVLAHMAGEGTLIDAFSRGEDIHRATAALVFGIAPELVGPDQRRAAKTINFGLIYGMGAFSLARDLGVSNAEAQRFIDAYFARLPRVRAFLDGIKADARATGRVHTMFGRVRVIAGLAAANAQVRGNAERQAINAPVQGTAADLIKLAMIALAGEIKRRFLPARMLLQVHDELVLEVAEGAVAEVTDLLRATMTGVADLLVPLVVDIGSGPSWAAAKG